MGARGPALSRRQPARTAKGGTSRPRRRRPQADAPSAAAEEAPSTSRAPRKGGAGKKKAPKPQQVGRVGDVPWGPWALWI